MITIAIDIGGTFTDAVALDWKTGRAFTTKVTSTPSRLIDGIREATVQVLGAAGSSSKDVDRFVHGTTIGTNAVLERKGATIALLTTEGFEDVLEIGRLKRTEMYNLSIDAETPIFLAPRRRRKGILERVGADGAVVRPLDEASVARQVTELCDSQGVRAFAVCLLHSFRNPAHELRVREIIRSVDPTLAVSLSCEVDGMFREYERTVVTAFDAYLRPVTALYLTELEKDLRRLGVDTPIQVMQSHGGIASAASVREKPVSVLLSGPAAGTIASKFISERSGFHNVVAIDVGGTSADVSLIASGKPLISTDSKVETYPLRLPMVDLTTIGAGGGSIAWIDASGGFRVGPQSAGADPGPACYGRHGRSATVTDASVALGFLNPEYFAGGTVQLDADAAARAVGVFGERLGLTQTAAAAGIHRVINSKMADAIRLVSIRRGYDPRDFALLVLGGAGAVHGGRLAADLGIGTVIVPPVPGVLSALGLLVANIEHYQSETVMLRPGMGIAEALTKAFCRLEARVSDLMRAEGVAKPETARLASVRYSGQSHTLEVELGELLNAKEAEAAVQSFHAAHQRVYGHCSPDSEVEFVDIRVVQSWQLPIPNLASLVSATRPAEGPTSVRSRHAFFDEIGTYVETPVYHRRSLRPDSEIRGPAIIEQADTTTIVYPEQFARSDGAGNLLISIPVTPFGA